MSTRSWVTTALAVFMAAFAAADDTPPLVSPNVSGTLGTNGWYVSDVAVSWTVVDEESAVFSTSGCEATLLTQDDTARTYTCVASSGGGTTIVSQTIARDATAPVISFSNNLGTYEVVDQVEIFCNTFDPTSGIASTTCADFAANAFDIIGVNALSASAVDNAGNTATATASFEVVVTHAGIASLVDRFVTKESVARHLRRDLEDAAAARASGNLAAELRNMESFMRTLERETGRHVSVTDAETLLRLVALL